MKQIQVKNRLYVLPALLFYITLQSTEPTQTNTESSPDLDINRKHHHNPKPHTTEPYNNYYIAQQNNAGSFDSTFGAGQGYVINTVGTNSAPRAVVTQEDNKIVAAGIRNNQAMLVRYNNNGELDTDFGNAGIVIQNIGGTSFFNAVAMQESCSQKIVAVGASAGKCVLVRYYDNGTLDTQFGTRGFIRTDMIGELNAVAVQKDNKIVVAGYNIYNIADTRIVLMRYDQDGLPDNSFGTDGVVYTHVGRFSRANAITTTTIHGENKIVIVGEVNLGGGSTDIIVARYHENGMPDESFGPNRSGIVILDTKRAVNSAYDVVIQQDNKIVIVGSISTTVTTQNQFMTIRLNENGSFDTPFGNHQGIIITMPEDSRFGDYGSARSVVLDENEKIITMGYRIANNNKDNSFVLFRVNQDGTEDRTFGNNGNQSYTLRLNPTNFNKAEIPVVGAIQNDKNKLVLAGMYSGTYSRTASLMAVARYWN